MFLIFPDCFVTKLFLANTQAEGDHPDAYDYIEDWSCICVFVSVLKLNGRYGEQTCCTTIT
jgi:hypothetical protein